MDRTNREIVDSFVPNAPGSYTPNRLLGGTFQGEVPGYTGLLSRSAAKAQFITLNIPRWFAASTDPAAPDSVRVDIRPYRELSSFVDSDAEDLYFNTGGNSFTVPVVNPPDPVPIPIPEAYVPNGVWLVRFTVTVTDSSVSNTSVAQLLIVDETSPYDRSDDRPPAPTLPAGATLPLDRAYIQSQPGQTGRFPIPYSAADGLSPDDTVEVFFGSSELPISIGGVTRFPVGTAPVSIPLPLSAIQAETGGNYNLRYVIRDVANNRSDISYSLNLPGLAQVPVPADFLPALVDLAVPGDLLIHRRDVADRNGAIVRIPAFSNVDRTTDQITVTLTSTHGSVTLTQPVGALPFPISFQFNEANMDTLYGTGPARVPVTAIYTVTRATVTYPTPPLSTLFDLDLSVVGPNPNPNPPGPDAINTDLHAVVVEAVRPGGLFGPPNHLELVDVNRPARARIPLWDADIRPESQLPFTIEFNYGGRIYRQDVTVMPAGRQVLIDIPFADILALRGPTQQAFYTVSRAGHPNPQRSVNTTVIVDNAIMQMDAPTVQNTAGVNRTANCDSLVPANTGRLRIFIPGSDYLSPAEPVTVTFTGFQNNTTTAPGLTPVVRSFPVPNETARRLGFTVDLDTATVLYNPVNANVALLTTGSATVTVSTRFQGQTVNSTPATIRVRGYRPGNGVSYYCEGAVVPT